MIPNNVPEIFAFFDSDAGRFRFPVVAWDDQGRALVADADGALFVANENPHFDGLLNFSKTLREGPQTSEGDGSKRKSRAIIL